jgi:hypothetical protein
MPSPSTGAADDDTKPAATGISTDRSRKRPPPQATVEDETNIIEAKQELYVYYTISIDGRQSRIMKAKVHKGGDIDSIIDEIKKKNSILLASIPTYRIELHESFEQKEPLNALEKWSPNAIWGTKQQPLIVKSNPFTFSGTVAPISPWKRSFGEFNFCMKRRLPVVLCDNVTYRCNNVHVPHFYYWNIFLTIFGYALLYILVVSRL